jgi:LysM repeat protein
MKSQTLPVKRRPAPKGIFKRLSAVTRSRKQRVAATATAGDFETEDSSSRISRALTIIFLIHIIAIGMIFFHQVYLEGRSTDSTETPKPVAQDASPVIASAAATPRGNLPRLSSGDTPYIVRTGDNYPRIAAAHGVDESDLRLINKHVEIGPGLILKIPPKRLVEEPAPVADPLVAEVDNGLVDALPANGTIPAATVVRPNVSQPAITSGAESYVVKSGDTIWRIATRYNVTPDALMRANNITDARKVRIGMTLNIP